MINRGYDLRRLHRTLDRICADIIALPNDSAALDSAAGEINGPALWPMIAAPGWIDLRGASEFSKITHQGLLEHAALRQVLNQRAITLVIHRRHNVAHPLDG